MSSSIDANLLERFQKLAKSSLTPLADMSMTEIASALGMTRNTLYRKAGTREQIVAALQQVGIDAKREPDVYERVVAATVDLLRERPIANLTLDLIADRARCSLPAVHARFGGRRGVLKEVIERHSPLLPMEELIVHDIEVERGDLRDDIRLVYRTLFPILQREWPVLRSFIAELLRDPDSEVGNTVRDWYLPQVSEFVLTLIRKHMELGTMRRLPIPIVVQYLMAPVGLHVATRRYVTDELRFDLPDPEATIEIFTDMFCRAVETGSHS